MSTTLTEYGPFTPQETDRASTWLKNHQIDFTIEKDEETEKLEMMNDGKNLVTKAEFRTSTYLGQIFYITPVFKNEGLKSQFEQAFGAKIEIPPEGQSFLSSESTRDEADLHSSAASQKRKKQFWAGVAAAILIGFSAYNVYRVVFTSLE